MPFYNHLKNWNGLEVEASPSNPWRKRFPFWPFFVGQRIQFDLKITKEVPFEKNDLSFHLVERMSKEEKPRMVAPHPLPEETSNTEKVFRMQNSSRITSTGEVRYWISNRGYNVDHEPIFAAEAVSLDSLIIPSLLALIIPLISFILGLVIGILLAG